jgi:hypothetical protein
MGMIQWIMDNGRYNTKFLSQCQQSGGHCHKEAHGLPAPGWSSSKMASPANSCAAAIWSW